MRVELIKKFGWVLEVTEQELKEHKLNCRICKVKLKAPFFYCNEFKECYCISCDREWIRPCKSKEIEHTHYNIKEVRLT